MKIVLISCSSTKISGLNCGQTISAKDLYVSALFKKSWEYANKQNADKVYILSAKYGLLKPDDQIEYYDMTLKKFSVCQQKEWAKNVLDQLKKEGISLEKDDFILLAGKIYYKYLLGPGAIQKPQFPYQGKRIGQILHFLNEQIYYEKH